MDDIRAIARGRWLGILRALHVPAIALSKKNGPCPMCGGKDRYRWTDFEGDGCYYCSGCGPGNGFQILMSLKGWDFKQCVEEIRALSLSEIKPRQQKMTDHTKAVHDLWHQARPISAGDPVGKYLAIRRCEHLMQSTALRMIPWLDYGERQQFPCMIARISLDKNLVGIHRTWVDPEKPGKAPVEQPRKSLGKIPPGACIALFGPKDGAIGVAEGIETAGRAMALFGFPFVAAISALGMERWQWPQGVAEVTVAGDNDHSYTGQAAAFALAKRLVAAKVTATVRLPMTIGADWGDQ